ncbi:MAG: cupin domain-containing protein [Spirochaetes bacterium]|nr:cupin domain-containing protein [Spirochaetota bacterium]
MYFIKPYFKFNDKRGGITGITQDMTWKEVNFITSKKGYQRGDHYHKRTLECFYIIEGKIKVITENIKTKKKKRVMVKDNDIFVIEPYEIHIFEIIKDSRWINMLSKPMNLKNNDFFK